MRDDLRYQAIRLGEGEACECWLNTVFSEESNLDGLPPECRNDSWTDELMQRIADNEIVAFMGVVDSTAAGLFWAAPLEAEIWSCHQFVMPYFRGIDALGLIKAAVRAFFYEVAKAKGLMGITDSRLRAAYVWAMRAGFRKTGTIPELFEGREAVVTYCSRSMAEDL